MAGAWGKLQRRHPERGSATLQADDAASARASARGSPLRAAQTRRPALPGEAAGAVELLWAHMQLAHAVPVWADHRGRARQHRTEHAGWGDARGQHRAHRVVRSEVLCASPSAGNQSQRQRSGRHERRRTRGGRAEHLCTALTLVWPLVRARWLHVCTFRGWSPDRRPPRESSLAAQVHRRSVLYSSLMCVNTVRALFVHFRPS